MHVSGGPTSLKFGLLLVLGCRRAVIVPVFAVVGFLVGFGVAVLVVLVVFFVVAFRGPKRLRGLAVLKSTAS